MRHEPRSPDEIEITQQTLVPRSPRSPDSPPRSPPSKSSSPPSPSPIPTQQLAQQVSKAEASAPLPGGHREVAARLGGSQLILEVGDPVFGLVEIGPGGFQLLVDLGTCGLLRKRPILPA